MSVLRLLPELPLLRRELSELSARRRTYVFRVFCVTVIIAAVMWKISVVFRDLELNNPGPVWTLPVRLLGWGERLFTELSEILFIAVQLLMPALVSGVITMEKERNTLGLLFVTRLSPLRIVLEKLGSRLLPMLTLLLITFPMLALAYSLGGLEWRWLLATFWLLFWECLLWSAAGLLCSAYFRTSAGACLASYGLVTLNFVGMWTGWANVWTPFGIWRGLHPVLLLGNPGLSGASAWWVAAATLMWSTLPTVVLVLSGLQATRVFLVRRAFSEHGGLLLRFFRRLDAGFECLNGAFGGVQLFSGAGALPESEPIVWRERRRGAMGSSRYLLRLLLLLELPTLLFCVWYAIEGANCEVQGLLEIVWFGWWLVALLVISVRASTLISSERSSETLDILLSTPLTGREILRQKVRGLQWLLLVLSVPILTVSLTFLAMWLLAGELTEAVFCERWIQPIGYIVMTLFSTWTVLQLLLWLAVFAGGGARTQVRSVVRAVSVSVGWLLVSWFVVGSAKTEDGAGYFPNAATPVWQHSQLPQGDVVRWLFRLDGALQASHQVLRSGSPQLYGLLESSAFRRVHAARDSGELLAFGGVVLNWHFLLMCLIRWWVLRGVCGMLGRSDFVGAGRGLRFRRRRAIVGGLFL